jgi:hypothetical protein
VRSCPVCVLALVSAPHGYLGALFKIRFEGKVFTRFFAFSWAKMMTFRNFSFVFLPIDAVLCLDRGGNLERVIDKLKEAENEDNNNNVYIQTMRGMGVRESEGRQCVLKGKDAILLMKC